MAFDYKKFKQAKAIESANKKKWLAIYPALSDTSGIYILTREDEDGFRYAYIGQAKHILTRLAQHSVGYQHIDLSLKSHGLISKDNPHGWQIDKIVKCQEQYLDDMEQKLIKQYADLGYQLRNKTSGSQGKGKRKIDDFKPSKTYTEGLNQGRKQLAKELSHIRDLHLEISLKKPDNKVSQKALAKFNSLINPDTYEVYDK